MNTEQVIVVDNVTKTFRMRTLPGASFKAFVLEKLGGRYDAANSINALDEVSFSVSRGETLGIIGANGAGKSTLLSLITGTTMPTEGTITTHGTISPLLELGAGFHPDLTGRENVFLYGAILGLSKEQMRKRFEAIVKFAELEHFIDQPVKHYSSGMYIRLGFAVAVEVDPDILLIDEVLAVGDLSFQKKCLRKMAEFRKAGKTMLIISHDISTIQSISDRILLLDNGKVFGLGDPAKVVESYQDLMRHRMAEGVAREWGTGEAKITGVEFTDEHGTSTDKFKWGSVISARISYEAGRVIENPVFGFAISDKDGRLIYGNNTQIEKFNIPRIEGKGSVTLKIEKLAMATGTYLFSFSLHSADHRINYHRLDNKFPVAVESTKNFEGPCFMPCSWSR